MNRRRFLRTAGLVGTTALAGCFLGDGDTPTDPPTGGEPNPTGSTTAPTSLSARLPAPSGAVSVPFGFDCGGTAVDGTVAIDGLRFVERTDDAVSITGAEPPGGWPAGVEGPYATNATDDPIAGTGHDALYRSEIYARDLVARVGLEAGTYDVTLHFAPIVDRTERPAVFDVAVESRTVGTGVDLHEWGHDVAVAGPVRSVEVTGGVLDIATTTREGASTLSGFAIYRAGNAPTPTGDTPTDAVVTTRTSTTVRPPTEPPPPTDPDTPPPTDPDTPPPTTPPTPADVPPASLRAYYPLDGTNPGDVVRGLGGSIVGNVQPGVPGRVGEAYAFYLEQEGYIDLPAFGIDGGSASIALWVNADAWGTDGGEYSQLAFWGDDEPQLEFGTEAGQPGFFYNGNDGLYGIFFGDESTITLPTDEWVHLAGTYNHDRGMWAFYVDGEAVARVTRSADLSFEGSANRLGDHAEIPQPYQGKMDDVRFYEGVLTEDSVRRLANV